MKTLPIVAGFFAALSLGSGSPAQATDLDNAEKLRKLDIMLMVTSLRCRTGADAFQPEYQAFSKQQLAHLNGASRALESNLSKRHGAKGGKRALDKISVGMANRYGNGHPWMSCGELKNKTRELTGAAGQAELLAAADELLADDRNIRIAAGR